MARTATRTASAPRTTDDGYLAKDDARFVNTEVVDLVNGTNRNGGAYLMATLWLIDETPQAVLTAAGKRRRPDYQTASKVYASNVDQMRRIADAILAACDDNETAVEIPAAPVTDVAAMLAERDALLANIARLKAESDRAAATVVTPPADLPTAAPRKLATGALARNRTQANLSRIPAK